MNIFKKKSKTSVENQPKIDTKEKRMQGKIMGKFKNVPGLKTAVRMIQIPFIGYLLLACVLNFVLEVLSRHSFMKAIRFVGHSPTVFFYNAFIIFVTLSLVLFAKRKLFATIFVCAAWIASAFANWIVLCFRTTPFSAIDILMLRNVMTMLDKYMTKWQMVLSVIGIILVIILLGYLYVRLPKTKHKRHPLRASAYVCMCIFLIVTLTKVAVETQTVSDNFGNLAYAYNDYGFAYCFSNSIIDVGISKPKDYNEQTIQSIVKELTYSKEEVVFEEIDDAAVGEQSVVLEQKRAQKEKTTAQDNVAIEDGLGSTEQGTIPSTQESTEELDVSQSVQDADQNEQAVVEEAESETQEEVTKQATKEYPNIIVIQLESVFDTKYMNDFYASENPMPFLAQLKRKYSSGLFTVPAVGAGTANTEFEVQTGMSTQFFGAGEYPFKTVMRDVSCDSMAYDLKRIGYTTTGFHNNDATFYERHVDYANLGFDNFSGMEHMWGLHYTPRGWAKDNVLDNLMIERIKQTPERDYITTITVQCHGRYPKRHTETLTDLDCYFTGEYANDKAKQAAWEYYINMCNECDDMIRNLVRKLEQLDEPTVLFMYGDHLPSLDLQESDLNGITLYQTEWVMWDNIGLKSEKKDIKSYQASTYIFNRLHLPGGLMQNFHNKYMNLADEADYLHKLNLLEYDTLYGNRYSFDGTNPFPQTKMMMGIRDIEVNGYEVKGDRVWIYGNNFNEFSKVSIDSSEIDTIYAGEQVLIVNADDFKVGAQMNVVQVGDDHIVLSKTDSLNITEQTTYSVDLKEDTNMQEQENSQGDTEEVTDISTQEEIQP